MEEPKKLIYDSGEQPEEVFLRAVSYTHLDVYKRQALGRPAFMPQAIR